jgi:hypothetical protein
MLNKKRVRVTGSLIKNFLVKKYLKKKKRKGSGVPKERFSEKIEPHFSI